MRPIQSMCQSSPSTLLSRRSENSLLLPRVPSFSALPQLSTEYGTDGCTNTTPLKIIKNLHDDDYWRVLDVNSLSNILSDTPEWAGMKEAHRSICRELELSPESTACRTFWTEENDNWGDINDNEELTGSGTDRYESSFVYDGQSEKCYVSAVQSEVDLLVPSLTTPPSPQTRTWSTPRPGEDCNTDDQKDESCGCVIGLQLPRIWKRKVSFEWKVE